MSKRVSVELFQRLSEIVQISMTRSIDSQPAGCIASSATQSLDSDHSRSHSLLKPTHYLSHLFAPLVVDIMLNLSN